MPESVTVIGAGSSGLLTSIELARRGFEVALIERGTVGSGTSGRFHGLLHSGARYAVVDRKAALDCYAESTRIKEMAPHCVEQTGGLFVAINKEDETYGEMLQESLKDLTIPFSRIGREESIAKEPNLSEQVRESLSVPDAVLKGSLFLLSALMTAESMGVRFLPFRELSGADSTTDRIKSLRLVNRTTGMTERMDTDFVVNCSGPWISETSRLLGLRVDVLPTAGVMSVVDRRLTLGVVNRMRRPSDGDILVPYGNTTIAGTTAAITENPDTFEISEEDVEMLMEEASAMVPLVSKLGFMRSYASFRPLVKSGMASHGRETTRDFSIVTDSTKVRNLACIVGGKMTTCRLVGEKAAEAICVEFGARAGRQESYRLLDPFDDGNWDGLIDERDIELLSSMKNSAGADYEALLTVTLLDSMTRRRSREVT